MKRIKLTKYIAIELSSENNKQLFVPWFCGFGSKSVLFAYKVDNVYAPDYDAALLECPILNMPW